MQQCQMERSPGGVPKGHIAGHSAEGADRGSRRPVRPRQENHRAGRKLPEAELGAVG